MNADTEYLTRLFTCRDAIKSLIRGDEYLAVPVEKRAIGLLDVLLTEVQRVQRIVKKLEAREGAPLSDAPTTEPELPGINETVHKKTAKS